METKYSQTNNTEPLIITGTGTGNCFGNNHMWTYSLGINTISEGTPCDCGATKYKAPKICHSCGQTLSANTKQE